MRKWFLGLVLNILASSPCLKVSCRMENKDEFACFLVIAHSDLILVIILAKYLA